MERPLEWRENRAHPRVCGENIHDRRNDRGERGSSPRVRGKQQRVDLVTARSGLIPACAGKTLSCTICGQVQGAHPRVCGENCAVPYIGIEPIGSSPRVRGKLPDGQITELGDGLIPACAGKTLSLDTHHYTRGAHPRVCGEN